jgi:GMP synthase (glutamine-hydrolysing)
MFLVEPRRPGQPQVLLVLHQETSSPGRIGMLLQEMGYALDIRRPVLGHELPQTMADHAGAVIFGGPPSANDADAYIRREIDWIGAPLAENKPFLGICLGAQMLVKHLGGEVKANDKGLVEIGYYPIRPTNEGARLMDWPAMVYQWHREGFSTPCGCTQLATGEEYPNQAIRCGEKAFGVQFHTELTFAMLNRWTTRGAHRFDLPGAQGRKAHIEGRYLYDAAVRQWLVDFLNLWIGPAQTGRA